MAGRVGFIGLGNMGVPMAGRLADAGLAPLVWARRPESAEPVIARGAEWADTVDALFTACDRVVLMLADANVMDEVLGRGTPDFARRIEGVTLIHMGTTPPGYSAGLAADVTASGGHYAEMPVSGSTGPAATGDLVAMSAGSETALALAEDIVLHMCQGIVPCGEVPKALQMKLAVNTYLFGLTSGLFEAFNLARQADLDRATLARVLQDGPMNCDLMRMKLPKLLQDDFAPQGSIRQACNNMQMIVDEGTRVGAAMPISETTLDLVTEASRIGWDDEDIVAITKVLAERGSEATGERA
ncbi:MAG: NAD(P)-dependent oxidoreductase [Silicimonas sp.]|nr:NAD(P)-dependent oxidoreductase [Silicimonas sp.]